MRIVWSRRAVEHLNAIRGYIERDDPGAAERVARHVAECVGQLVAQPLLGRLGRVRGTRELVITGTPYIVPYRFKGDRLEMIAVFHGRQNGLGCFSRMLLFRQLVQIGQPNNFKNSLKASGRGGIAIRNPTQAFQRSQPLLDWTRQPILDRVVQVGQAHHGELRAVEPEVV
jgi:toxin ParE1/3/4